MVELREVLGRSAHLALLDHRVRREVQVHKVIQAILVILVLMEWQETSVFQVPQGQLEHKE